jgi:hypothetical protein
MVISGFLRRTFLYTNTFLSKICFLVMLFIFLTGLAGCTVQTGPPTGFTATTLQSRQVIQNFPLK